MTVGNQGSISFDTITRQGKKSFQINIETENDTISKEIDNAVEDVKNELANMKDELENVREEKYITMKHADEDETPSEGIMALSMPIIIVFIVFSYLAFRSYQNRKWKESLLNKGLNSDEINKLTKSEFSTEDRIRENDVNGYEKRKSLKYMIIFISIGAAIILHKIFEAAGMDGMGFGFLFLFLGIGYFYYHKKTN